MSVIAPVLWSLPWIGAPLFALWRSRRSRWLDDVSAEVPANAPFVSVIIPARNERRNIERCVRSVLSTHYAPMEVIVVDDHSVDGTGDIARAIAANDARVSVISAPELPAGWFGKQWACTTGARVARGTLLLFTDADTRHAEDLLSRAVNALQEGDAALLSIAGHQEMHSFWERIIQPQIFTILSMRFGGTENVSNARRAEDVIANGQFMLVKRDAYDAIGGHESVRDRVAEDLAMAQAFHRAHQRLLIMIGIHQFSTHMYASLAELVAGWRKNMYAGGRTAVKGGAVGRAIFPLALVAVPIVGLAPPMTLALALAGVLTSGWLVWSAIVVIATLAMWTVIYRFLREPVWYALLYPLGHLVTLYIAAGAIVRGQRVEWKGRAYVSR